MDKAEELLKLIMKWSKNQYCVQHIVLGAVNTQKYVNNASVILGTCKIPVRAICVILDITVK